MRETARTPVIDYAQLFKDLGGTRAVRELLEEQGYPCPSREALKKWAFRKSLPPGGVINLQLAYFHKYQRTLPLHYYEVVDGKLPFRPRRAGEKRPPVGRIGVFA